MRVSAGNKGEEGCGSETGVEGYLSLLFLSCFIILMFLLRPTVVKQREPSYYTIDVMDKPQLATVTDVMATVTVRHMDLCSCLLLVQEVTELVANLGK